MATIFLTGGRGEIGHALLDDLVREHSVIALTSNEDGLAHSNVRWVSGKLEDISTYAHALKGCDVLIHLAAETRSRNPEKLARINVDATEHLVDAAHKAGIKKIIVFSSAAVTQNVHTPYANSKLEMEKRLLGKKYPTIILRPTFVYQPGSRYLKNIAKWILLPLPFVPYPRGGKANVNPLTIEDLKKVIYAFLKDKKITKTVTYELASEENFTLRNAIDMMQKKMGVQKPVLEISPDFFIQFSNAFAGIHRPISAQLNAIGVLGESYRVDSTPIRKKYGIKFSNPHVEMKKCLEFLKK